MVDQTHKLSANIDNIIATECGAIAAVWYSHWRQPNYDYREPYKLFLVRRGDDGSWAVLGWKLEEGETPEAAVRREVLEECGVEYAAPLPLHALIDGYVTYIAEGRE